MWTYSAPPLWTSEVPCAQVYHVCAALYTPRRGRPVYIRLCRAHGAVEFTCPLFVSSRGCCPFKHEDIPPGSVGTAGGSAYSGVATSGDLGTMPDFTSTDYVSGVVGVQQQQQECVHYFLGFCKLGPKCRRKHTPRNRNEIPPVLPSWYLDLILANPVSLHERVPTHSALAHTLRKKASLPSVWVSVSTAAVSRSCPGLELLLVMLSVRAMRVSVSSFRPWGMWAR